MEDELRLPSYSHRAACYSKWSAACIAAKIKDNYSPVACLAPDVAAINQLTTLYTVPKLLSANLKRTLVTTSSAFHTCEQAGSRAKPLSIPAAGKRRPPLLSLKSRDTQKSFNPNLSCQPSTSNIPTQHALSAMLKLQTCTR